MLQLKKVSGETADIVDKKIAIICTKKLKVRNERMMKKEIVDSVIIRGQQSFENFEVLNPIEIKMENNQILNVLQKHLKK